MTRSSANLSKAFPAKLLLFGEYTILMGSQALALPLSLNQYSGRLECSSHLFTDPTLFAWREYLIEKTVKLAYLDFDFNRLTQDLNKGLVFKSNIPYGYGLGSSGTLCAAVLSYYADQKLLEDTSKDPDVLKEVFIEMESFFHEKSSGLDPLVSFYNRAVFVPKKGEVELCTSRYEDALSGFYLIDSQQSRQTAQWVQTFRKHLDAEDFYAKVLEMADLQTACIAAFRQGDNDSLEAQLLLLSKAQIWAMKEWVSTTILEKWIKGIDTGKYYMKLCGAGGGGYFLAYVPHRYRAVDQLPDWIPLG